MTLPSWATLSEGEAEGEWYDARERDTFTKGYLADEVEATLDGLDPNVWPWTMTVRVHRSKTISDAEVAAQAAGILDELLEQFGEEYGHPDGGEEFFLGDAEAFRGKFAGLVREVFAACDVWQCERVGEVLVDVEAYVRAEHPDWLEDEEVRAWLTSE